MKHLLLALSVVAVLFSGCKKEEDNTTTATCTDGIKNGTETGVDCGGSCAACISDTYYPLTAGTTHKYKITNQSDTTVYMASDSVTSKDTVIDGINYRIILEENQYSYPNQNFVRNSNGSLYALGSMFEQSLGSDQDFLFIKENAANGITWTANVSNIWGSRICEVTETNLTVTLNGMTFNNVCVTRFNWEGHPTPFSTAYHAKGVGLIKTVSEMGTTMEITSYTIK